MRILHVISGLDPQNGGPTTALSNLVPAQVAAGLDVTVLATWKIKDGFPVANPQDEDTVTVAPGESYTVLVHATEPGTWVWHCHILPHAENENGMFGMVTALVVK